MELPLLPGGPVRRPEPGDRQHDPAQARAAVPRVGRGDRADLPRGRASRRTPTSTSTRPTTRSRRVIADPRVRGVSLTGSERAGAAVAEIAGRNLKKVVLELGGSDPFILLGTDDLDAAVESAVGGRLENTGQACNAAKRFIVARRALRAVPGEVHGRADGGQAGRPDARRTRRSARCPRRPPPTAWRTRSSARSTRARSSWPAASATATSSRRTVLTGITPDNDAYREEFFGPVAAVYRVGSEDEAVELANDTPFGLGSYVMTNDPDQALRVADRIDAGHGVRQRRRRRGRRAAVRRRQALRASAASSAASAPTSSSTRS